MRNRWEDSRGGSLDDPVTLTERQLRSLKRGARAGLFALILAFAAAGLVGWSSVEDGKLGLLATTLNLTRNHAEETATGTPGAGATSTAPDSASRVSAAAPESTGVHH